MTPSELHLEFFLGLSVLFNVLLLSVGLLRFIMRSTETKEEEITLNNLSHKRLEESEVEVEFDTCCEVLTFTDDQHNIIKIKPNELSDLLRFVMEAYFKRYGK